MIPAQGSSQLEVAGGWRRLTFLTLPIALVGGALAAYVGGGVISLGSLVGFLTVLGIVARNSIMLISHYQHLEQVEGVGFGPSWSCAVRGNASSPPSTSASPNPAPRAPRSERLSMSPACNEAVFQRTVSDQPQGGQPLRECPEINVRQRHRREVRAAAEKRSSMRRFPRVEHRPLTVFGGTPPRPGSIEEHGFDHKPCRIFKPGLPILRIAKPPISSSSTSRASLRFSLMR